MDTERICQSEGYKAEDLNKENQAILRWLRWLEEDFSNDDAENIADCFGDICLNSGSIIDKMRLECMEEFMEAVKQWIHYQINEIQIGLAQNEEREENEDD